MFNCNNNKCCICFFLYVREREKKKYFFKDLSIDKVKSIVHPQLHVFVFTSRQINTTKKSVIYDCISLFHVLLSSKYNPN